MTIDEAALGAYLEAHWPGFKGPVKAEKFAGGQSNPTFMLTHAGGKAVLRKKPPGQLLKSAHAVDREYRVMKALDGTGVPVPAMHALCEDESVIGTAFYVMEFVDGRIIWDPAVPEVSNEHRAGIYDAMNAALAALHMVDPAKVGLADFGRPGNYFARQLSRWAEQYRASETEDHPDINRTIVWLEQNLPADDGRSSLVHGDYRIDNMIFAHDEPRLLAILDWELSTIGHPFADIAYQCMHWRLPHEGSFRGLAGIDRKAVGIPTEAEYVARYCQRTGLDGIPNWGFYLAFSLFRMAAILQGVLKRALTGNASNPERALKVKDNIPILGRMAVDVIDREVK
ncbi:MAG: phosphotransferase family protein [Phreatobacter sp.]|uniref:phosphotransferase family protein n=1 Tax=Phreatobacter sp. TaxID=1966341 RepID=UPI001A36FC0C|nr:phosphotransferase family protein [Phreatobacter sp.]MBL8570395.1 phosphotransferase family protein [Phreatobacter sp.]